jgi:hypothetical protein
MSISLELVRPTTQTVGEPPLSAQFPNPAATSVVLAGATLVTLFRNQFAKTKDEKRLALAAVAELIKTATAKTKAGLPWIKYARFGGVRSDKGCLRHNANVLAITGVEGDHDNGGMSFDEACRRARQAGVLMLLYTTASHTEKNPRWRALCPLSTELRPEHRDQMMARLNGIFVGVFAGESWVLSQAYHYGGLPTPHLLASRSSMAHRLIYGMTSTPQQ